MTPAFPTWWRVAGRSIGPALGILMLAAGGLSGQEARKPELVRTFSLEPEAAIATWAPARVAGRQGAALVLVGRDGLVTTWTPASPGSATPGGSFTEGPKLPHPARSLLALVQVGGAEAQHLVVHGPQGVTFHRSEGGTFAREGRLLVRRARLPFRVGAPRFAAIADDVNADGRTDLLLPGPDEIQVWVQRQPDASGEGSAPDGPPLPVFESGAGVEVDVDRSRAAGALHLSDMLENAFTIARLELHDLNADGRKDIIVVDGDERAFHLQRDDGTFPARPDVTLDLDLFRDTTPKAPLEPGQTLAGDDATRLQMRDLDGDGMLDFVLAHRRKVWVFHGTREGPQFKEPTAVVKSGEDLTAVLLLRVDDDPHADLVFLRVQVPTVAALVLGMLGDWEVDITAVGYPNLGGRSFAPEPRWRRELSLTLPSLAGILQNPEALIRRFELAGREFEKEVTPDLDGDGAADLAVAAGQGARLEVWLASGGVRPLDPAVEGDLLVRSLLFEGEPDWDLERVIQWVASLAEKHVAFATGGKPPDATLELEPRPDHRLRDLAAADLDGDGRAEIIAVWESHQHEGRLVIEGFALR